MALSYVPRTLRCNRYVAARELKGGACTMAPNSTNDATVVNHQSTMMARLVDCSRNGLVSYGPSRSGLGELPRPITSAVVAKR